MYASKDKEKAGGEGGGTTIELELLGGDAAPHHGAESPIPDGRGVGPVLRGLRERDPQRPLLRRRGASPPRRRRRRVRVGGAPHEHPLLRRVAVAEHWEEARVLDREEREGVMATVGHLKRGGGSAWRM